MTCRRNASTWLQERSAVANLLRKQRTIKLHAFARVHDRLPVARQMIRELRDEYVRQQAAQHEQANLGAHMADHAEAGRYVFELLGDVLAQLLHLGAAFGTALV
jgi:hypothetical protein